jgi:predicted DNA-binding protein (MmcQ/YjbR family)
MTLDSLRDYCLAKPGVTESLPFGPDVLVFKVLGKMFLLTNLAQEDLRFNVKCDPERAVELRDAYPCVQPGYHMNKAQWNTIIADGSVPDARLREWIDDSYRLIVASLPKKQQKQLVGDENVA